MLCLDTSTADVAAAAVEVDPGELAAGVKPAGRSVARIRRDARGAGEHLMPLATAALSDLGARLADVGAVAVGLGPGPYTGLRVGVVTAAVLGRALRVGTYGACSLDIYAEPDVVVATDARRREVFWAAYDADGVRVEGPAVNRPVDLAARLGAGLPRRVVGPGAVGYPELLGPGDGDRPVPVERLAGLVAADMRAARHGVVAPIYLRRPDAAEPVSG